MQTQTVAAGQHISVPDPDVDPDQLAGYRSDNKPRNFNPVSDEIDRRHFLLPWRVSWLSFVRLYLCPPGDGGTRGC